MRVQRWIASSLPPRYRRWSWWGMGWASGNHTYTAGSRRGLLRSNIYLCHPGARARTPSRGNSCILFKHLISVDLRSPRGDDGGDSLRLDRHTDILQSHRGAIPCIQILHNQNTFSPFSGGAGERLAVPLSLISLAIVGTDSGFITQSSSLESDASSVGNPANDNAYNEDQHHQEKCTRQAWRCSPGMGHGVDPDL